MKTIEEFIKQIEGSADLQNELKAIKDKEALEAFLVKNGVSAPAMEFAKAMKAKAEAEGMLSDDDAEAVAGGQWEWLLPPCVLVFFQ